MADESDFLELLIANDRVAKLLDGVTSSFNGPRGMQAIMELRDCVTQRTAYAEEAHRIGAVKVLTRLLAKTADERMMDAISDIITACAGTMACPGRLQQYMYDGIPVHIKEGALGDGLGAKVWAAAHVLCKELTAHPELVRGHDVLEIGAGCGVCGILAAKIGSNHVTLSDCEGPVLQLLRDCVHLNSSASSTRPSPPASIQQHTELDAMSDITAATATEYGDAELFDEAESVEDFDLADLMGGPAAAPAAAASSMFGGSSTDGNISWCADNMSVVFMDWCESIDLLDGSSVQQREEQALKNSAGAPTVPADKRFCVIIASEVMYEPAHAVMVAAVLAHRLQPGGRALLSCAVRCVKTFAKLGSECALRGLRCRRKRFSPSADYGVVYDGVSAREEEYEGGHLLLAIDHASEPALDWHRDDFSD